MPVLNAEAYIRDSLQSILHQTWQDFEILVVDSGSSDSTLSILQESKDSRVRVLHAQSGLANALNLGIREAQGVWIARQDADDISVATRLETQINAVEVNSRCVLCHSAAKMFGSKESARKTGRFPRSEALFVLKLCYQNPVVHSSAFIRKDAAQAAGGYRSMQAEDYEFWSRLINHGGVLGLSKALVHFRQHASSASKINFESMTSIAETIGINNCARFMGLSSKDAVRAHAALKAHANVRGLKEWLWLFNSGIVRLQRRSAELYMWWAWQALKGLVASQPKSL